MSRKPVVEVRRSQRRRRTVSAYRDGERVVVLIPAQFSRAEEREWVDRMLERLDAREQRSRRTDDELQTRAQRLAVRYLADVPKASRPVSVRWVRNQNGRWGSCTPADRTIRISHRVQDMPDWVIPSKAPNKEGAKEFLRGMLSVEGAGQFAELTKSLSSRQGSGDKVQDTALASANAVMKNASKDLVSWKFPDFYADYDKESQNLSLDLMAGRLTAQQFVDKMQATADKIAADPNVKKQTRTS